MENNKNNLNHPDLINQGLNNPDLVLGTSRKRCRNCRQVVEVKGDVCPNCGHYLYEKEVRYQPIERKTARKIKLVLGLVLLTVFAALVAFGVFELKACSNSSESQNLVPEIASVSVLEKSKA